MRIHIILAWVKDSGDEWSPSSGESDSGDATDVIYEVEYEIAESSDSSNQSDSDSDSSSNLEVSFHISLLHDLITDLYFYYLGCTDSYYSCQFRR